MSQVRRHTRGRRMWFLGAGGLLLVVALVLASTSGGVARQEAEPDQVADCNAEPYAEIEIDTTPRIRLELARTAEQRQLGLMFRESMDWDSGMLFEFGVPSRSGFWMRNTYLPLSIAWLDGDGIIVDIQDMEPLTEDIHYPAETYWFALELNQGWFTENGVGVGHRVLLCLPSAEEAPAV